MHVDALTVSRCVCACVCVPEREGERERKKEGDCIWNSVELAAGIQMRMRMVRRKTKMMMMKCVGGERRGGPTKCKIFGNRGLDERKVLKPVRVCVADRKRGREHREEEEGESVPACV